MLCTRWNVPCHCVNNEWCRHLIRRLPPAGRTCRWLPPFCTHTLHHPPNSMSQKCDRHVRLHDESTLDRSPQSVRRSAWCFYVSSIYILETRGQRPMPLMLCNAQWQDCHVQHHDESTLDRRLWTETHSRKKRPLVLCIKHLQSGSVDATTNVASQPVLKQLERYRQA